MVRLLLNDALVSAQGNGFLFCHPGFEDPVLLQAAKSASSTTLNPSSFKLRPWEYTPSLALTFPTETFPLEYFMQGWYFGFAHCCTRYN